MLLPCQSSLLSLAGQTIPDLLWVIIVLGLLWTAYRVWLLFKQDE